MPSHLASTLELGAPSNTSTTATPSLTPHAHPLTHAGELTTDALRARRPLPAARPLPLKRILITGLDARPLEAIRALPRGPRILIPAEELDHETPRTTLEAWVE